MSDRKKDSSEQLPVNAEANRKNDDRQLRQQEEFDNKGKDSKQRESEVRNTQKMEQLGDSQQGEERMIPTSKEKGVDQNRRDRHPE